jgi:23S rRNA pseudouridine955/2504/2580 synthase
MMDRLNLVITESDNGTRLDRFLRRHHPDVNQGRIEKLLRGGVIKVDGDKAKSSFRLEAGMQVSMPKSIITPDAAPRSKKTRSADPQTVDIVRGALISKGEGWLVLNKPSGLATQGGSGTKHHVDGALAQAFPEYEKCRLVHRLDRDTSGLLVIATDLGMSRRLAKGFQHHDHDKTYLALVSGTPKLQCGKITAPLRKSGSKGNEKMVVDDAGQSAVTLYRTLEQMAGQVSLLALRPKTGRTHQLRAHMSFLGCPILGDGKYGGAAVFPNDAVERLCLHAASIYLDIGARERKHVIAPLQDDMKKTFNFFGLNPDHALDLAADPDCFEGG